MQHTHTTLQFNQPTIPNWATRLLPVTLSILYSFEIVINRMKWQKQKAFFPLENRLAMDDDDDDASSNRTHTRTQKKWFKFIVQTSTDESSERAKCRIFVLQMPEYPWAVIHRLWFNCKLHLYFSNIHHDWLPGGREIKKVITTKTTTNRHLFAARSSGRTCANHLSQWIGSNARLSAK